MAGGEPPMTLASAGLLVRVAVGVVIASVMLAVSALSLAFGEGSNVESLVLGGAAAVLLWFSLTRR